MFTAVDNVMDVFLLPSKGEGFGIPLIEAQACGIPVIITKCTGHEELMGGGWFVENLVPEWTAQSSWQYNCDVDEVVEKDSDLSSPPLQRAKQPNRMSPAGVPMFYGAEDFDTAFQETFDPLVLSFFD